MEYVWLLLLALALVLYVVLDGFDLGVGVLTLFTPDAPRRAAMMSSIGSIWDANETWLLVAGTMLFGAFPTVYGVVLNALYVPISLMLFGLIFRAVSFEFRVLSNRKRFWEMAFGAGSLLVVVSQGFAVGGLLSGISVRDGLFDGGAWDWLTPVSIFTAIAVGFGYVMLGSGYLLRKMPLAMLGPVRAQMAVASKLMLLSAMITAVLSPFLFPDVLGTWLDTSWRLYVPLVGIGILFAFLMLTLATRYHAYPDLPLVSSLAIIVPTLAGGLAVAHPWLVPGSLTLTETAAPGPILIFMLFGVGLFMPLLLIMNIYLYRVFRGREGVGYEEK